MLSYWRENWKLSLPDPLFINPIYIHKTLLLYYALSGTRYVAKNKIDRVPNLMEHATQPPHNGLNQKINYTFCF